MRRLPLTRHKAAMRRHRSQPPPAGGGFLKGALGAAAGVAGGVLLADSIRGLFHGGAGGMGGLAGANLGIGSGFDPVMHETVINNYYGDADSNGPDEQIQLGHRDQYDGQSQDAGYDGDGIDSGDDSYDV